MPDDFDLFPDRKNLDPFSFGKEEKAPAGEKAASADRPAATPAMPAVPAPAPAPVPSYTPAPAPAPSLFDSVELPHEEDRAPETAAPVPKVSAKGPSKIVVFGGIILVVLGLGYLVQTYLFAPQAVPPTTAAPVEASASAPGGAAADKPAPVAEAPAVQPAPVAQAVQTAAPAPVTKPAKSAEPVKPAPAAKALPADKSPSGDKPAAPAAAAQGKGFMVQVGGAALKENLDAMVKTVKEAGFEPVLVSGVVREGAASPGPIVGAVTVMSGPFAGLDDAQTGAGHLQDAGIPAILVKGKGGEYSIKSGSFASADGAKAQLAKIKGLGLPVRLEGTGQPAEIPAKAGAAAPAAGLGTRLTLVRVGPFADEAEATRVRDLLAGKGFKPILIRP